MINFILPEIILSASLLFLLMLGVFSEKSAEKNGIRAKFNAKTIADLTILALLVVIYFILSGYFNFSTEKTKSVTILNNLFIYDNFTIFIKLFATILTIFILVIYGERIAMNTVNTSVMARFELPLLIGFSLLGMMLMLSANNFLPFYLAVELTALSSYLLTSFKTEDNKSSEAGLKYFILGAMSSGLMLFGISYIYGFLGTIDFNEIKNITASVSVSQNLGVIFGVVMVLIGLFFKISAVPFHMWVPDVYEGAGKIILAFFAVVVKFVSLLVVFKILSYPFVFLSASWQQIIILVAILSMMVGAFGAIKQKNIKRFVAYSGIKHVGFILLGLAFTTEQAHTAVLNYIFVYIITSLGLLIAIIYMRKNDATLENISDLAGVGKSHPLFAFALSILLFSMAGIPPMAGFFAKFYILKILINFGYYWLAIIAVIFAGISAFYYLRIIKVMYFDEPINESSGSFDKFFGFWTKLFLATSVAFSLFFFLFPEVIGNINFINSVPAFSIEVKK